jgi:hypothetical protein
VNKYRNQLIGLFCYLKERDTFWLSAAKSQSLHLLCPDLENYLEQIIDLLFDVPFEKKD